MQERIVTNDGYIMLYFPSHKEAQQYGAYKGYVYEHIPVAEKSIGRKLRKNEDVHHLDFNKVNNRPTNLLVLEGRQHQRLHHWLRKQDLELETIDFKYGDVTKALKQCKRCKSCGWPLRAKQKFTCSVACHRIVQRQNNPRPSKKRLLKLLKKMPWTSIAAKYDVSDNAIRKWAIAYGIDPKSYARGKRR